MDKNENTTAIDATLGRAASDIFWEKIVTNDLILDIMFSCCSPATFLRFSRTCRTVNWMVKSYMRRAFRVDRLLSRFFSNPLKFRQLQAGTAMLVAGSAALQFFDRTFYPESDLDLYVSVQFFKQVGNFLLNEGYIFTPDSKQFSNFHKATEQPEEPEDPEDEWHPYRFKGVCHVFTFTKERSGETLKVQMLVAKRCPIEVVLFFHSSE